MPPKCYICNYYDPKRNSLFRVPDRNDEYSDRSGLWLKLLEEKRENINRIRICAMHFVKKKPAKNGDYLDVDWVPSENLGRFTKNKKLIDSYYRTKKKFQPEEYLSRRKIFDNGEKSILEPSCSNDFDPTNTQPKSMKKYETTASEPATSTDKRSSFEFEYKTEELVASKNSSYEQTNSNLCCETDIEHKDPLSECNLTSFNRIANEDFATATVSIEENSNEKSSVDQVYLFTKNAVIPLKKRKFNIEKLTEKIFLPKEIQTDLSSDDVDNLFEYFKEAVEERNQLLLKISTLAIDVGFFEGDDKKTKFYTGLTTWPLLKAFFEMVESFLPTHFNCKLSKFQMVALTLMKLRLNLSFTDLGYRFQINVSTASRYFHRCIFVFFKLFYGSKLIYWPDERNDLFSNIPSYFRSTFKDAITIIVDCFELFIECPSDLFAAAQGFSVYKHHVTLKYLIGISTTGAIIFFSRGYGGRASDKKVTLESGFLDHLLEGDFVLADKGFLIEKEVEEKGAFLRMPCFVKNGEQLNPHEVEQSRHYSSIRIHVERLISVVREKFNICSDIAKMSAVSKYNDLFQFDLYDKIVFICCCLVNICPSVVSSDFEM